MSHILDNHSIFNMIVAAVFVAAAVSYVMKRFNNE